MNATTEEVMKELRDRLEADLEKTGAAMEADLKKKLSTPVIRNAAGTVIRRSAPGSYPFRETGRLMNSVQHTVYRAGGNVRMVLAVNVPYANHIHRLRPFFVFLEADWKRRIETRLLSGNA